MADNDILLKLKLLDEYSAELRKFSSELRKTEGEATKSTGKVSAGFGSIKDMIGEVSKAAAFTALIAGLKNVMSAASAAEQSNAKLGAALKATGQYTAGAVASLDDWSVAMMRAKGVDDELAKSLVADAVAKGKNVEQAKRLTEAAADMAPVVGSVEAAMGLLIRASNGSTEALKRYGIEVTDAEAKSGDFESVLQRVEKQFSGQAAAQVETYAGQIKVLAGEFDNFKEAIGEPLIKAGTDWLVMINRLIVAHGELDRAMNASAANATYRQLADQLAVLGKEKENLEKLVAGMDDATRFGEGWQIKLNDVSLKYDEVLGKMVAVRKEAEKSGDLGTLTGKSSASKMTNAKSGSTDTSKRKVVSFYGVNSKGQTELEEALATKKALKELNATRNSSGYDLESTVAGQMDAQQDAAKRQRAEDSLVASYDLEMVLAAQLDEQTESRRLQQIKDFAGYNLDAVLDEFAERKRLQDEELAYKREQSLQIAADTASTIDGMLQAVASGDYIGALQSGLKAFGGAKGQLYSEIVGLFATIASIATEEPRTSGGKARKELRSLLKEAGFTADSSSGKLDKALTDAELGGMADFWNDLAEQITGVSGGGQGGILAAEFEDLGLSIGQTIDAVGGLVAAANDLTAAEGDQAAAAAALLSVTDFTTAEIGELAQAYGDATNFLEQKADLEDKILESAQAYADATGSAKDDALKQLEADRAEYLALVVDEANAQKKSDEELVAALEGTGMSTEEAKELVNSQKSATEIAAKQLTVLESIAHSFGASVPAYHSGSEHLAMVRSDELIAPPEKFREARDYLNQSLGDSGGSRTIVLTLDGKTVAKVVDGHTRAMQRTKEIAA